jgi:hypothetical protein
MCEAVKLSPLRHWQAIDGSGYSVGWLGSYFYAQA